MQHCTSIYRTVYYACYRGDHLRKTFLPLREKASLVKLRGSSSNLPVRARWLPLSCSLLGVLHTADVVPAHFAAWFCLSLSLCIAYRYVLEWLTRDGALVGIDCRLGILARWTVQVKCPVANLNSLSIARLM